MSVIVLLILFSLIVALLFLAAFIWSVRDGQFEDDFTPSVRILFDDDWDSSVNPQAQDSTRQSSTPII